MHFFIISLIILLNFLMHLSIFCFILILLHFLMHFLSFLLYSASLFDRKRWWFYFEWTETPAGWPGYLCQRCSGLLKDRLEAKNTNFLSAQHFLMHFFIISLINLLNALINILLHFDSASLFDAFFYHFSYHSAQRTYQYSYILLHFLTGRGGDFTLNGQKSEAKNTNFLKVHSAQHFLLYPLFRHFPHMAPLASLQIEWLALAS